MEIIPILGVAIASTLLILIVRQEQPELALLLSLTSRSTDFLFAVTRLGSVIGVLESLAQRTGVNPQYFT